MSAVLGVTPSTALGRGLLVAQTDGLPHDARVADSDAYIARVVPHHDHDDPRSVFDAYLVGAAKFCLAPPAPRDVCVAVAVHIVGKLRKSKRNLPRAKALKVSEHLKTTVECVAVVAVEQELPPNNVVFLQDYLARRELE